MQEKQRVKASPDVPANGTGTTSHKPSPLQRRLFHPDGSELAPQQLRAVETFFHMFADLRGIGVPDESLAPGVKAPSDQVLAALSHALASPVSSIDVVGASNVEHLASVFRGVLADAWRREKRQLTQDEVDVYTLETVLTDAFMKGRSPADLARAHTVPTNYGDTGATIFEGMKRHLKKAVDSGGRISGSVRRAVYAWIDRGAVPDTKDAVWHEAANEGFTDESINELVHVWKYRIMQAGRNIAAQGFLQGVWLHGIPAYLQVAAAVIAARGDDSQVPEIMEAVLGHHMAGFVAAGFAKGGLCVDFGALEKSRQIPQGAAARLEALYDSATRLADKWRPQIDRAAFHGHGLAPTEREEYRADADYLRLNIALLPDRVRSQLLNDDSQQFTDLGMPKWLAMGRAFYGHYGEISNGELLRAVYGKMVQPYLEENMARGSGEAFLAGTEPFARRLGMRLEADAMIFRPAGPEGEAFHELAHGVVHDPALAKAARRDLGKSVEKLSAETIVDWFIGQPADIDALARLAGGHGH